MRAFETTTLSFNWVTTFSFGWVFGRFDQLPSGWHESPIEYTTTNEGWRIGLSPVGQRRGPCYFGFFCLFVWASIFVPMMLETATFSQLASTSQYGTAHKGYVGVFVNSEYGRGVTEGFRTRREVEVTFLCRGATSKTILVERRMSASDFTSPGDDWGFPELCKRDSLIEWLADEELLVEVELYYPVTKPPPNPAIDALHSLFVSAPGDVQFNVRGQIVHANRHLLASRSEYFQAMFSGSFVESCNASGGALVNITDTTEGTFRAMLWFLYSGLINVDKFPGATLRDLYFLADKHQMTELIVVLEDQIIEDLTPATAMEILFEYAHLYPSLRRRVAKYIRDIFQEVETSESFKEIMEDSANAEFFSEIMEHNVKKIMIEIFAEMKLDGC